MMDADSHGNQRQEDYLSGKTPSHFCVVSSSFVDGSYTPICDCSWKGRKWGSLEDALDEWENHLGVVFVETLETPERKE